MRRTSLGPWCLLLTILAAGSATVQAEEAPGLSSGQTVYVPAYSHIYAGNREMPILLTITVSIRNIDLENSLTVTSVDYYETQGKLLERFVAAPVVLGPLQSMRFVIPERDKAGGSGANFIVRWEAGTPVNAPIIEAVMIGAERQQGISFTSRGRALVETD